MRDILKLLIFDQSAQIHITPREDEYISGTPLEYDSRIESAQSGTYKTAPMLESSDFANIAHDYIQDNVFDMDKWKNEMLQLIYKGDNDETKDELRAVVETIASEALVRRVHNVDIHFISNILDEIKSQCTRATQNLDAVKREVEYLRDEIEKKDSEISEKSIRIDALNKLISEMEERSESLNRLATLAETYRSNRMPSPPSPSLPSPPGPSSS